MKFRSLSASLSLPSLALVTLFANSAPSAQAAAAQHNVPKGVAVSSDLGRVAPSTEMNLTVVLNLHNRADFDKQVAARYDAKSPLYHQWFTDADYAKYAPTAAEFQTVKQELTNQGFTVLSENPRHLSIRVHGTANTVERAFQTELHNFSYQGKTFQAHTQDAHLAGPAGDLVHSVAGLERHTISPMLTAVKDPRTGKPLSKKPYATVLAEGGLLGQQTDTALSTPKTFTFADTGYETAVYTGSVYGENPNYVVTFTPQQLQAHYGLNSLLKWGYDGTGQTIALVEAYGYDYAKYDADTAAAAYGLPPVNLKTIYPEGLPFLSDAADLTGWTTEIALDVQTAHAIAPGAKIVVVASAGQDNEDQIASLEYIIDHHVANTVSSSWENDSEIVAGAAELDAFNDVLAEGAAAGISFQFSSGDSGDGGIGSPVGALGVPADSPYATSVGGTSILWDPHSHSQVVAGWGNDLSYINLFGPVDPPSAFFYAGAGGGESIYFPEPWYQTAVGLPSAIGGRQVPDVSALADPFTGVVVIATQDGTQYAQFGIGGTSLASPLFTAIWAIADQYNGAPLGQAAPLLYNLKPGQITDVTPSTDLVQFDPVGTIQDWNGTTSYSPYAVFQGASESQTVFPSAIWPLEPGVEDLAISFGTDSSLTVTPGWDNVTGNGEPNGLPFIQAVTGKTTGAPVAK